MSDFQFHLFAYGADNYGVLVHDPKSGETACVDAGDAARTLAALTETGWSLSQIWITHHHWDHTDGLLALKEATGAHVIGPDPVSKPIEGLDQTVGDGAHFQFAGETVEIIHTPGHTTDMINFYLPQTGVIFTGDTLFTMGCGRIFEGDAHMMWQSLEKLLALPTETIIYSSHEYTLANARFAVTVDPQNRDLADRLQAVEGLRDQNEPTVPTTLREEMATNPFLRAGDPAIRAHLGMHNATDADVFAEIRRRKDNA